MADIGAIREALAEKLGAITGLKANAYVKESATGPVIQIFPADPVADYDQATRTDQHTFTAQVLIPYTSDVAAQKKLDEFIGRGGPRSIKTLLEAEPTLAGACDDVLVTGVSGYDKYTPAGGGEHLGANWRIEVTTTD